MSKQRSNLPEPSVETLHALLTSYLNDPDPSLCVVFGKKETFPGARGNKIDVDYHFVDKTGKEWKATMTGANVIISRAVNKPGEKDPNPRNINVKISPIKPEDIMMGDYKKKDTATMSPEDAAKYNANYQKALDTYVKNTNMLVEIGKMLNVILPAAFKRWYTTISPNDPDVGNQMVWPIFTTRVKVVVDRQTTWKELAVPYFGIKGQVFHYDEKNAKHIGAHVYNRQLGMYWAAQKRFVHLFKKIDPNTNEKHDAYNEFTDGRRPVTCDTAHLFITRNSSLRTFTIELGNMNISTFGISFSRKFAVFKDNVVKTHISAIAMDSLTPEQRQAEQEAEEADDLFDAPDAVALDFNKLNIGSSGAVESKGVDQSAASAIAASFEMPQLPPQPQQLPPQQQQLPQVIQTPQPQVIQTSQPQVMQQLPQVMQTPQPQQLPQVMQTPQPQVMQQQPQQQSQMFPTPQLAGLPPVGSLPYVPGYNPQTSQTPLSSMIPTLQ